MEGNFMKGATHLLLGAGVAGIAIQCKQMDVIADDLIGQATYLSGVIGGALMSVAGLMQIVNVGGVA